MLAHGVLLPLCIRQVECVVQWVVLLTKRKVAGWGLVCMVVMSDNSCLDPEVYKILFSYLFLVNELKMKVYPSIFTSSVTASLPHKTFGDINPRLSDQASIYYCK